MIKEYERIYNENYPVTYHTFLAKANDCDELVKYYVQDLTQDHINEAVELLEEYFTPDETFLKATHFVDNEENVALLRQLYRKSLGKGVSLACLRSDSNELVGLNCIKVQTKGIEESGQVNNKDFNNVISALQYVMDKFDVYEYFNVDHYVNGIGLCVNTDYRGRGIATEILKARAALMQCLKLTVTSTVFTTIGSQKAAKNAGYKEQSSTSYEELNNKFTDLDFSNTDARDCKIFTMEIK